MTKASDDTLRLMERLRLVVDPLPPVFPTPEHPVIRPLALGSGPALQERVQSRNDMPEGKASSIVARVLRAYVRRPEYNAALAAPGAWRHDLEGNPTEPVTAEHSAFALSKLAPQPAPGPKKETIVVKIPAMKVNLMVPPSEIRFIADTVKTVDLTFDMGDGRKYVAPMSGKNWRRAFRQLTEIQATGAEAVVILQGRLVSGGVIEGAGLTVQQKLSKAG
ncbi:hypothetical protein IGS68_35195 (plasmid) [Skermanella sp. TT6]|uniref:ProQ/FinO domain-containing protein n=1 Tax=Skermanella cutis TaxID=2775420 RepID=A0ABX7BJ19_9PROT|nr:ProQ/FINO family protein [Skermanella sp. TT6]QQP94059.1 hypothetical protein IGS68_35195 [Skermanella sp. TT6]